MIVTIPHYGNSYIGLKVLFDGLGIHYVIPPQSNQTALDIGVFHSPEEICQPFKLMLGNYIQSIEKGADTIIILATNGPCRFGEYANFQQRLLKKAGYDVGFIVLYTQDGKKALFEGIKKIGGHSSYNTFKKMKALLIALKAIILIDDIEAKLRYLSGYEKNQGECKRLLHSCYKDVLVTNSPQKAVSILKNYKNSLKSISLDLSKKPLKIAIIGEIYTISEPFSNKHIEDHLMDYGISISRSLTPSWWLKDSILKPFKLNSFSMHKAAKEYIYTCAGGYTRETVGKALIAHKEGYDGAIQIFPIGCTPEVIAKPILEKISTDKSFPILTLIVDEMTGEEGFMTRVEAFTDMLERRRERCII
ncbi:MAG: 2-hydroxyglutaryl-CoA dehydratase [Firmicutes bacterium HGW-Firmicutes-1]|jgi:predicted nucleotide-binding protein (sugar kinase/HSP70/actin superfamily)|nr:MAG: 2-hydroxyglutaryl-CoA dehydratase [Firmicutes bacterium HGW-Firmicutes-1]